MTWDELGTHRGLREDEGHCVCDDMAAPSPTDLPTRHDESNRPRKGMKSRWSVKYKRRIDCSNPRGFSQKQYCRRKRRGGGYKS